MNHNLFSKTKVQMPFPHFKISHLELVWYHKAQIHSNNFLTWHRLHSTNQIMKTNMMQRNRCLCKEPSRIVSKKCMRFTKRNRMKWLPNSKGDLMEPIHWKSGRHSASFRSRIESEQIRNFKKVMNLMLLSWRNQWTRGKEYVQMLNSLLLLQLLLVKMFQGWRPLWLREKQI